MKRLFLLLTVLSLSFVSCEKDECTVKAQVMELNQARTTSGFIEVCHVTGNGSSHTITIPVEDYADHIAHGDTEGACSTLSDNNITAEAGEIVELPCDFDFEGQKISNGKYYKKL